MKYRDKDLAEILDFLGVRILCDSVHGCYHVLGVVHTLWPPIEGTIKDYIAMPKANGYQSLHTVVMSYQGKTIEIQIPNEDRIVKKYKPPNRLKYWHIESVNPGCPSVVF